MKFLNIDSPLMQFLGKMADLMILNMLTLLLCLPVITAGAALTALNYMTLKIVRGEDCYIVRGFFKSFKENFLQATAIWLIFLVVAAVLAGDIYIIVNMDTEVNKFVKILIAFAGVIAIFTFMFVFPVQAKFSNPIRRTIKNAFAISILQFPKTVLMIVLYVIPGVLFFLVPRVMPIVVLFGFSIPALLSAKLYDKFFKKLEDKVLEENGIVPPPDEDEHIFSDEIIVDSDISQNN